MTKSVADGFILLYDSFMFIRCPKCGEINEAKSSDFGNIFSCQQCKNNFSLDIDLLARFDLPDKIEIVIRGPQKINDITVIVEYGYQFPPLKTNAEGKIIIWKEMFCKAQADDQREKAEYDLCRFISINIFTKNKLKKIADNRKNSGWPILSFEKELYDNIDNLMNAYTLNNNFQNVDHYFKIDLEQNKKEIDLAITI